MQAEVSPPGLAPGRVTVALRYSAVSPGTEGSLLDRSGKSFLSLALEKRHRVDRLWAALRRRDASDLQARLRRLAARSQAWIAPGYSASGIVQAVGEGVTGVAPGDRVAVAGAGYAVHAELVTVPVNLLVPVPRGLDLAPASTVALGAIALQAVRRADARIGERVLVLGLGLLGQMAARILLAGGCRVLGWDPRAARCELAARRGVEIVSAGDLAAVAGGVAAATEGRGADQVILAAAAGAEATDAAARATRRGGVLVLLGDVPVVIDRAAAYERELTVRLSTSYGPGRYDPRYEEEGIDYPFAHVRWTEQRNMAAWLELLAGGRVAIEDLIATVSDFDAAAEAYAALRRGDPGSLGLLLRHAEDAGGRAERMSCQPEAAPPVTAPAPARPARERTSISGPVRVALIGAGDYAREGILPALASLGEEVRLELLAGAAPARRDPLARQYGFTRTTGDHGAAAQDEGVDLVVVATRHDEHEDLVLRALVAGRAVYCEKPLALSGEALDRVEAALQGAGPPPFLAVGFNRRFAPATLRLREELAGRRGPLQIAYRVQAGRLPAEHWIRGPQGGGRLIGEGVHMVDLCRALVGHPLARATVMPGGAGPEGDPAADNFVISLGYEDGSTATILYTSRGASAHPKERIELHWDGRTLEIDNFAQLRESGRGASLWQAPAPRKGQAELWKTCIAALRAGRPSPTPIDEVLETSRAVVALEDARRGA